MSICSECYLVHSNHYSIISNFCHHVWKGQWRPDTSHTPPLVLPPAIIFKSRLVLHWRLIYYLFWVHNMWLDKSHFCNLSHTCSMGTQLIVQNKKIVVFFLFCLWLNNAYLFKIYMDHYPYRSLPLTFGILSPSRPLYKHEQSQVRTHTFIKGRAK